MQLQHAMLFAGTAETAAVVVEQEQAPGERLDIEVADFALAFEPLETIAKKFDVAGGEVSIAPQRVSNGAVDPLETTERVQIPVETVEISVSVHETQIQPIADKTDTKAPEVRPVEHREYVSDAIANRYAPTQTVAVPTDLAPSPSAVPSKGAVDQPQKIQGECSNMHARDRPVTRAPMQPQRAETPEPEVGNLVQNVVEKATKSRSLVQLDGLQMSPSTSAGMDQGPKGSEPPSTEKFQTLPMIARSSKAARVVIEAPMSPPSQAPEFPKQPVSSQTQHLPVAVLERLTEEILTTTPAINQSTNVTHPITSERSITNFLVTETSTPLGQVKADVSDHDVTPHLEPFEELRDPLASQVPDARGVITTRSHVETPRLISAQLVEVARTHPDKPLELTLNPEELGRLRITFHSDATSMNVVLQVERPETMELMRRHIDLLAQDMKELGFEDVNFTFQQQDGGSTKNQSSSRDSKPEAAKFLFKTESQLSNSPKIADGGASGVDIRI